MKYIIEIEGEDEELLKRAMDIIEQKIWDMSSSFQISQTHFKEDD